jgi:hypothetical protein
MRPDDRVRILHMIEAAEAIDGFVAGRKRAVGSLAKFLDAIRTAGVPKRVTFEFLKTLGFTSSNDRPIIGVLKSIGFLDQNGVPTESYKAFRDPHQGRGIIAL